METASKVMYTIANIFTWILVFLCVGGIVLSALSLAHVLKATEVYGSVNLLFTTLLLLLLR